MSIVASEDLTGVAPMRGGSERRPAIVAVDDEPTVLAAVSRDLRRGFGERYRILRATSGPDALDLLRELLARGERVAMLIADQRMPAMPGTEYLVEARKLVLPVRIVAESACRLAIIASGEFLRLVFTQRAVHQSVIRRISPVMQRLGGIEQNRERLASLGTMAAGLAHELNNPAAGARRAAAQLAEEVGIVQSTLVKFVRSGVERADAEQLVELQEEAIGALGERGTITIRTSCDGDCAVVEISDDGPGIPDDLRERIFDPFFTTKDVGLGTGLGLATARRIVVDRHDGSLVVESEPGDTMFRVRLPLIQH